MEKPGSEDVVSDIRACLVSSKNKLELRQLDRDYYTLVGYRIPFSQFGYKRLEDFLRDQSTLVVSKSGNGDVYVDAKSSEKSAHIKDMVYKQKKPKKKVLKKAVRFTPNFKPAPTSNWRPKDVGHKSKPFQTPPRLAKVSHNQFINSPVTPPKSQEWNRQVLHRQNSEKHSNVGSRLQVTVQATPEVQKQNGKSADVCPLNSTKRRISEKMSEISLDKFPVWNGSRSSSIESSTSASSPLSEKLVAPTWNNNNVHNRRPAAPEFVPTGDPVVDLRSFVNVHKIGELEVSCKVTKAKNPMYMCKIKVGKHIYMSYPKEFHSAAEAEKHCSKEALEDLMMTYKTKKSLLVANEKDILSRIPPMLEKHNYGIWAWQLQLDYTDKYHEELPTDWLKIIDSSPCIQVEKCLDSYVLRHCKPGHALQKGLKWNTFMTLTDVSVPSNTVQFGDDGKLFAEVTCVMSANEIWCRQQSTEESEIFSDMIVKMETYYDSNRQNAKVDQITEAGYYVAVYENLWYRVRAVSVSETEVLCFLIDYGDEIAIPKSDIYQLMREFASSQAQAFVCRLAGLENLYEASVNSENMQKLLYKYVIVELAVDNIANDMQPDFTIPVYMYDLETGESLNQEIIPLLTIESASPIIQKDSRKITEVYVSNIENNGDVYVQLHSPGFESLQQLVYALEGDILSNPPTELIGPVTKQNSVGKLYFAKYAMDGHWYRVQLIDWSPHGDLAQMYFVDYGNAEVIKVNEEVLYPLDKLSEVLSQYPPQAVKVRMGLEEVPANFLALASKEMPLEEPVLLKVMETDKDNVPCVEFFKRNTDGGLFCINKSIVMEAVMKKEEEENDQKKKKLQFNTSKNVPSGGTLSKPPIPKKGEYFGVRVPFAVNPYNFFVQPLAFLKPLNKMMSELQERYKNVLYSPLQLDQIVPGNIYASKHEDGNWYRTNVIKVIHSGSISVFYCDFGYYGSLTVQQLFPLDSEFMKLPYQALKAKLGGIKPKQSKWTMADCESFKTLTENKNFYSVISDIEKDELYESDTVLKLLLVDTSSNEDVSVGNELIKMGIAVEDEV